MDVIIGEVHCVIQVETNLEELPISDAVVTQKFVVVIQNCSGLGIILGVIEGEGLI